MKALLNSFVDTFYIFLCQDLKELDEDEKMLYKKVCDVFYRERPMSGSGPRLIE